MDFTFIIIIIVIVLIVGIAFLNINKGKESFVSWNPELEKRFSLYQSTVNPKFFIDLSNIEQQATESEAETLLATGSWPWEPITQQVFVDHVQTNTILKKNPTSTMEYARRIYNNNAAKELLSWSEPEGHFLLTGALVSGSSLDSEDSLLSNGSTYGYNSGLISPNRDIIRCEKRDSNSSYKLTRIHNSGNDGITQVHNLVKTDVDYNDLPRLIKGFSFSPKGSCDPCLALNGDYSCPFSLADGSSGISSIWKNLWGFPQ